MQNLHDHLDKIHTTPLGLMRIKHNLKLQQDEFQDDVVSWCQEATRRADLIIGQGKNWYVYYQGNVITIHAKRYTIITAQPLQPKIRLIEASDVPVLSEFLYQAIFIPKGAEIPPRSIIRDPQIAVYINDFGSQYGDLGVVAEQNGQIIGAAWTRIIPGHGHIDDRTPELAISILPEFRGYGIGMRMMRKILVVLAANGFKRTSLSVQKDNPAVRFYKRLGYHITHEKRDHVGNDDWIMIKDINL